VVSATELRDPLTILAGDRELPAGCDRWTMRSVHADLRSSNGFRWPFPGQWATAPGPIIEHDDNCPRQVGDGICVATTYAGMASGGIPARTVLLCAIAFTDVLAERGGKLRVRRAFVVDVIDGERAARAYLARAYLARAYLARAYLTGANLAGADLARADLTRAYLAGANLTGADLAGANYTAATTWPNDFDPAARGAVAW
jgi:hypothetical protein